MERLGYRWLVYLLSLHCGRNWQSPWLIIFVARIDLIQRTSFSAFQGPFGHCDTTGTDHAAWSGRVDDTKVFGYSCMVFLL